MAITTQQIKELREATSAGIMDCRKALEQADGDTAKALEFLRQQGLEKAAKRSEREASEGVVELYSHGNGRIGVMVEVNSETDFVARSPAFREFAHEVALQIAAFAPKYVKTEQVPAAEIEQKRAEERAHALAEGKPAQVIEKIVDGRVDKWLDEVCLLRQPYVRDETMQFEKLLSEKIVALGENVVIRRFQRWQLGESESPLSSDAPASQA
jgi:elongation factor Ts